MEMDTKQKSRRGTGTYMVTMTAISAIMASIVWKNSGFEYSIFLLLLIIIMSLSAIRFNQK